MKINSLKLSNFRCFKSNIFSFDAESDIVFITGNNGTGKTSILEAIFYSCYLKSFRTHLPAELIRFNSDNCAIISNIHNSTYNYNDSIDINLNLANLKRSVKLNQKSITSCKELYNIFKVITLTADDLKLIQDGPLYRRSFIDQTIAFTNPEYSSILSKYKRVLDNRNALLYKDRFDIESYLLWSDKFFQLSKTIQKLRISILKNLLQQVESVSNIILKNINNNYDLKLEYQYSEQFNIANIENFEQLQQIYPSIQYQECNRKRTLFGPHLDDIKIAFTDKLTRNFASRGEQKLALVFLKLAQIYLFNNLNLSEHLESYEINNNGLVDKSNTILLIDDFFSDFDTQKFNAILSIIPQITSHAFITCPDLNFFSQSITLKKYKSQTISL